MAGQDFRLRKSVFLRWTETDAVLYDTDTIQSQQGEADEPAGAGERILLRIFRYSGDSSMQNLGAPADVDRIMDRLMIDLYKGQIRKTKLDPLTLTGSWDEACTILKVHLGRLDTVIQSNEGRLLSLYRIAIRELRTGSPPRPS
jgi:hypothetical protein